MNIVDGNVTIQQLDGRLHGPLENGADQFLVRGWQSGLLELEPNATHFGFIHGQADLDTPNGSFQLAAGMYFSLPSAGTLRVRQADDRAASLTDQSSSSWGFVVTQFDYRGLFQLGGPIEREGRLRYIDGCSDTLLVAPPLRGEACLNLLCLPANTEQSAHTHPSFRVGAVVAGRGVCRSADGRSQPLHEQSLFVLQADCVHSFHTSDEPLTIVAFHPDSDFGPWHDDHPMINRTLIDGVSARTHAQPGK